jgi:RimJ/RimL family protein N-acetyltransferase
MENCGLLKTTRLQIMPFGEEHLTSRYVNWLNDTETVRYSEQRHREHNLSSCREYWLSFRDTHSCFWAIVAGESPSGHIGNINAYVDITNQVADVGILIGERSVWRRGYGLEAWNAVCRYLFEVRGMRKITAGTISVNLAMLGIMRGSGMVEDGRRVRQYLWEGQEVDIVYAALFRESK